jgi:PAS domain S-box-containing protein
LESTEQAIVAEDNGRGIVLVNRAAEKVFGYSRAELAGQSLDALVPAGLPPSVEGTGSRRCEGRRKDGSLFPLDVHLSRMHPSGAGLTVAFMTDITAQHRLERLSLTHQAEIRALTAQLIDAQEEERRRVSRELHDGLCQRLAYLAFDIEHLAVALPSPAETRHRLRELRERAVQVSEEARNIAYELHPSVLDDLGLVVSLQALCNDFAKKEKIRVKLTAGKLPHTVPQKVASGLYRIAEESMQNVAKHAKARRLFVSLALSDNSITLLLQDDGVGFSPQAVKGKGGLGLVSIRERARILGGDLSIESEPKQGTRIIVKVPL